MGEISPVLFTPSVSRMTTLLFDLLCSKCDKALVSPIPMAVPGAMRLCAAHAQVICGHIESNAVWSVVRGHSVKASPPKRVMPILSLGRFDTKSRATSLAASMREGWRSRVSILVEMSMASTMSMPSVSFSDTALRVCGRAMTTMSMATANHRSR